MRKVVNSLIKLVYVQVCYPKNINGHCTSIGAYSVTMNMTLKIFVLISFYMTTLLISMLSWRTVLSSLFIEFSGYHHIKSRATLDSRMRSMAARPFYLEFSARCIAAILQRN